MFFFGTIMLVDLRLLGVVFKEYPVSTVEKRLLPITIWLHEILSNQLIVPQATNQIRWRTHLYTLGHSLSYFQADFAGRLANRVVQVGPAVRELAVVFIDTLLYVAIYAVTAIGLFGSISLWLALPVVLWVVAYAALTRWFVPRARTRSLATADTRSALIGRIVDSYTNILTVKLLLDEGADVTLKNGAGMTAIDFAKAGGFNDIVEGLTYRLKKAGKS